MMIMTMLMLLLAVGAEKDKAGVNAIKINI